jgi:hypothetical protein
VNYLERAKRIAAANAAHELGECPDACAKCAREEAWNWAVWIWEDRESNEVWRSQHAGRTPTDLELTNFRKVRCRNCEGFTGRHARYSNMGDGFWMGGEYCSECGHHEPEICDEGFIRRKFYRTQLKEHGRSTRVPATQG